MAARSCKDNARIYAKKQAIARTEAHITRLASLLEKEEVLLSRYEDELKNLYIESHGFKYQSPLIVRQEFFDHLFSQRMGWHIYHNINDVVFLTKIDEDGMCQVSDGMFCYREIPLEIIEKMRPIIAQS